jgi:hypothetical protein
MLLLQLFYFNLNMKYHVCKIHILLSSLQILYSLHSIESLITAYITSKATKAKTTTNHKLFSMQLKIFLGGGSKNLRFLAFVLQLQINVTVQSINAKLSLKKVKTITYLWKNQYLRKTSSKNVFI